MPHGNQWLKGLTLRARHFLSGLPQHPYEEQFSPSLDLPDRLRASRFVMIASTPRSGSHLLGHTLAQTGEFGVPLEYLNPGNARYWAQRFGTVDLEILFRKLQRVRTSPSGMFCFKAHWDQFAPFQGKIDELTSGFGIEKVLWIYRRSLLNQAVSFVIASQTGVWISGAPVKGQAFYSYDMIRNAAQLIYDQNRSWQRFLSVNYPDTTYPLAYESLVAGDRDLARHLGLNEMPPQSRRTIRQGGTVNLEWRERFRSEIAAGDGWIIGQTDWALGS